MKALTQIPAKITKPGGFSIHAIKYEVNFDDEELEQIGFRRIDDPDERILILQRLPENPRTCADHLSPKYKKGRH